MAVNFSAIFAREAAVVAVETGARGLELRKGGETFGGGAIMLARSKGLFGCWPLAFGVGLAPGDLI